MHFARPDGGVFVVGTGPLTIFDRYRQRRPREREAGGILLGRLILTSDDVILDRATTPTSADRRGRHFFHRGRGSAQRKVDDAWRQSRGTENYLGEWHTHPEDDPVPSAVDRANWVKIAREAQREYGSLFFIIVGITHLRAWEVCAETLVTHQLSPMSDASEALIRK